MRQAPIVVSIFGPQSSGKSTLLNYCFGCKFLTSAGRCTKGIYGSLARLSQSINLTNQFLILDTEGLDGGSKSGPSLIHFDRTMVLFCLAVSQVVIINIKGELGEEMQNMLQICAYSLLKLRVSKVVAPKIFFVLNQQADPDPSKHLEAMNNLLRKLEEESELMELEGTKITDLIQVSRKNLFILPSTFNIVQMNKPAAKLFNSEIIKLSPTIPFANRCAELRQSIINQLVDIPLDERATFNSMSEWLEMSGVIWETIIKYQDVVKYRNVDELKSYNLLKKIVGDLMRKHIFCYEKELDNITEQLICDIKMIAKLQSQTILLEDNMQKFDETFKRHHEECLIEFNSMCRSDDLLKRMNHICEEMVSNLTRLIYIQRKNYKDRLKYQIKAVLTEIKLTNNMKKFQEKISKNIDKYLDKSEEEQTEAFEEIWGTCFGDNEKKDGEENERDEDFDNLYTIFKMESKAMENKGIIHDLLHQSNFDMDETIKLLLSEMQRSFEKYSTSTTAEGFIYPYMQNNIPIKEMTPFTGEDKYEYLGKDTLYKVENSFLNPFYAPSVTPLISKWVPECCYSLINYCSGYYNHADITWEMEERKQILMLTSLLKDPNNARESTWKKFLNNISSKVQEIIEFDPEVSQGTVKQLVNFLCSTIKHVNYEINCIQARLSSTAERTLSTLIFVYAFKSKWDLKTNIGIRSRLSNEEEKLRKKDYFLSTVEKSKMARGNWDRKEMRLNDRRTSNFFALDFLEAVKRGVIADQRTWIAKKIKQNGERLSYKSILLQVEELITKELESQQSKEIIDQNNIVVQSICKRNEIVKRQFNMKWEELVEVLYGEIFTNMKELFTTRLEHIKAVLDAMLQCLEKENADITELGEIRFDSDSIFMTCFKSKVSEEQVKNSILKSAVIYLEKYLDPNVTQEQFKTFFDEFKVEGIKVLKKKDSCLCDKPIQPSLNLNDETFKKLTNTRMFDFVQIFNIHQYIIEFRSVLDSYQFELSRAELEDILKCLRDEFASLVLNCTSQCPSCGKFCERELHPHDGRCQIKTGHQICSMGGRVWKNDTDRTAVVLMCEDYGNDTIVRIPGQKMTWGKFKEKTGNEWEWTLPNDGEYITLQKHNRGKMQKIWDIFGRGILNYHASKGVKIKYIPYPSVKNNPQISDSMQYYICFVIASTGCTKANIRRNVNYFCRKMNYYQQDGKFATFKIVIYDNHRKSEKIIQQIPADGSFTHNQDIIKRSLSTIEVQSETEVPRAVLDGLATATTESNWSNSESVKNIIYHIYDAPPHGNFPNYKSHSFNSNRRNCCCCNHGTLCNFDWDKDVWERMHKFNIKYNGISERGKYTGFETQMEVKLGKLCTNYHWTAEKETDTTTSPVSIFIDYKTD